MRIWLSRICFILMVLTTTVAWAQEDAAILKTTHVYKVTLGLDYYRIKTGETTSTEDTVKKPLVDLVHGGGFKGVVLDGVVDEKFARSMAQKGYEVASISYRLTRKGSGFGCDCPARDTIITFLKATEDLMAAVDFLEENT